MSIRTRTSSRSLGSARVVAAPVAWIVRRSASPPAIRPADRLPVRKRVLIADEDDVTVRVLQHRLERDGLAVDVARDGAEAVQRLIDTPPDAALLNVALVGVDGFEVLRRVRAGEAGPRDLRIALMCWSGNDALLVRGFALDADDIIMRPFSLAEVSARVHRLARRAEAVAHA